MGWPGRPYARPHQARPRAQAAIPQLCQLSLCVGARAHRHRRTDAIGRRCVCRGDGQAADAATDARAAGSRGIPAAQARRRVAAQAALCAPGRLQSAHHRDPRQCAVGRGRDLPALPGKSFPCGIQAQGHAPAHRISHEQKSVRGLEGLSPEPDPWRGQFSFAFVWNCG
ncbi:hypothetical protein CBM2597_A90337 [Cupriavidus taiwanensis]|nr:hypothetical protein CBM2597_A90337 [Cupriavidus taiwanensis]